MIIISIGLAALGAYLTAYVLYQVLLFVANALIPEPPPIEPTRMRRFNVIVPAHNEELYLPRLLSTLQMQDYPSACYRVTVVADNCTDRTAAACERFDVDVFERHDQVNRGKGQAIEWALRRTRLAAYDAVVVIDGDSMVAPEFLRHLNMQMERGDRVIQCYNGVANPGQSWFTRLLDVSRTIANDILHPAKRKLGLSSHLMGNGMCFDVSLLRSHGWRAFSVGEDWEYYARLLLSGVHVGYSRHARVFHQESVNLRQAAPQRIRWSSGRFQVLGTYGLRLLGSGLRHGDLTRIDGALPLLFPNPSLGMNLTALGLALALVPWLAAGEAAPAMWYACLTLVQTGMFIVGVFHTAQPAANLTSLVLAPVFLAWKMGIDVLTITGVGRKEWSRTERRAS